MESFAEDGSYYNRGSEREADVKYKKRLLENIGPKKSTPSNHYQSLSFYQSALLASVLLIYNVTLY